MPASVRLLLVFFVALGWGCADPGQPESLPAGAKDPQARRLQLSADLARFPEAERERAQRLIDAVNATPNDANAVGVVAMLAHAYQLPDMAMAYYAHAAELAPEAFEWPYLNGVLLAAAGHDDAARAAFDDAAQINAAYPPLQLRRARLLAKAGRGDDAVAMIKGVVEANPAYAEAHFELGQLHLAAERFDAAATAFKAAVAQVPHYGAAHYGLASALEKTGDAPLAEVHRALFEKHQRGGPPDADRVVTHVEDMRNSSRQAIVRAGRLSAAGRLSEAAEVFEDQLERDPTMAVAYINLVGLYGQMGNVDAAHAAYAKGLEYAADSAALHLNYGVLLLREEDNAAAVQALQRAVEIDPGKSKAHKLLGAAHQRVGNNDAAIDSYARAFETDALDVEAGFALGQAQLAAGRFADAATTLDKTLVPVSQRTPTFLRALAQARLSSGDPQGAREALERARAVASDFDQSAVVEQIDEELSQLAEAGVATP